MTLQLKSAELFTTLPDDKGRVLDVKFLVRAEEDSDPTHKIRDYWLEAVLGSHYDEWYLEKIMSGEPIDDVPLVIPNEVAESPGLEEYVRKVFLDLRDPKGVNRVGKFLVQIDPGDNVPRA